MAGATATALYAEPAGGWLSPSGVSGSIGTTSVEPGAARISGTATLSLPELQTRIQLMREQTRADARHIQHMQQVARREKDVIKLNCVNDKLVQVKPQMNIADAGAAELGSSRGDGERAAAFESIASATESIRRLREEADQCIGEPTSSGGESSNSFSGPTSPDDPTKGFAGGEIEPPGYASPFN